MDVQDIYQFKKVSLDIFYRVYRTYFAIYFRLSPRNAKVVKQNNGRSIILISKNLSQIINSVLKTHQYIYHQRQYLFTITILLSSFYSLTFVEFSKYQSVYIKRLTIHKLQLVLLTAQFEINKKVQMKQENYFEMKGMMYQMYGMMKKVLEQNSVIKDQLGSTKKSLKRLQEILEGKMKIQSKQNEQQLKEASPKKGEKAILVATNNIPSPQKKLLKIQKSKLEFLEKSQIISVKMKQSLIKELRKHNSNLSHSQLLYVYENRHHFNFFQLIYGVSHILLIVKLKNGNVISAYSSLPFKKRVIPEQNYAFISNLSRGQYYFPKNPFKTICYDENNLIFGNSQIRIKYNDNIMYSNFGVSKGFYDIRDHNLSNFIGIEKINQQVERQFEIERYQIHQLL